ncbi:DNA alkylation repair protein [Myroides fluvii]|uniref:DNA alkylation repair protein n=1 Tax=Myroides fluvii TaxID=2572594 RepID=UPI00131B609D|nr:DNA alkylation repair protein [Myroides fluvii]
MEQIKRKGSKTIQGIPPEILEQLNQGKIETANLVEWLAIDLVKILTFVLDQCKRPQYLAPTLKALDAVKKPTITLKNATIGQTLLAEAIKADDRELFQFLSQHPADMPRCWATYMVGGNANWSPSEQLNAIQVFAADTHFGVRETAWMAVRPTIIDNLALSLTVLEPWTLHVDANIRRFATESTRPRGVWCAHIEALKATPALALPLLENLRNDPVKYVQDSVGNWLNDASKTQPDFVRNIAATWLEESDTKATAYIVKKALRTLNG